MMTHDVFFLMYTSSVEPYHFSFTLSYLSLLEVTCARISSIFKHCSAAHES